MAGKTSKTKQKVIARMAGGKNREQEALEGEVKSMILYLPIKVNLAIRQAAIGARKTVGQYIAEVLQAHAEEIAK